MKTKKITIERNGKIFGQTTDFNTAKHLAKTLGAGTYVFCNGIVVYPI